MLVSGRIILSFLVAKNSTNHTQPVVHGFPKFEDNKVTIDGGTNLAFSEDTAQIFAAKARELSEGPGAKLPWKSLLLNIIDREQVM